MILDRDSFFELEKIVANTPRLEYVVINFDFIPKDDELIFDKQFIPICSEDLIHDKVLNNILEMSLSFVVFSQETFQKNKENYILDIMFEVLEKRLSEETVIKIDDNLTNANIDLSSYHTIEQEPKLLQVISNTLMALNYTKKLIKAFSTLDENFLDEIQVIDIVKEHNSFDEDKYITLHNDEQLSYIQAIYDNIENPYLPILEESPKNIKNILDDLGLLDTLSSDFFDEDNYLILESSMLNADELYTLIYTRLHGSETKLYQNAKNIFLEIQREIKYVNLYEFNSTYNHSEKSKQLNKLYEDMTNNALSNVIIGNKEKFLDDMNDKFLTIINDIDVITENHRAMMEDELNNYYNGDLEAYEDQLSSDAIGFEYGADKYGVSMESILDSRVRDEIKSYNEVHLYENHHIEMLMIENYIQSKNIISQDTEEELLKSIPTTKLVSGKRVRLKKAEREKALKARKKAHIMKLQQDRENTRLDKNHDTNKSLNIYSQSLQERLYLQHNIQSEVHSFFRDAKDRGLSEEEAMMEENSWNDSLLEKVKEVHNIKDDYKSATKEIKSEQNNIKNEDSIIRRKGKPPMLSL